MIELPDVNVLLAIVWSNHRHHEAAHQWLSSETEDGWATCLWTQSAFLRLSLNPQVVGAAIDCPTAVQLLNELASHPRHQFLATAPALAGDALAEMVPRIRGFRQVSDATLLHLARVQDVKLVIFDQAIASLCPWSENLRLLSPM